MEKLLVVGSWDEIAARLKALLARECEVAQVEDSAAAVEYLRARGDAQVILSGFRGWNPRSLTALREEFPSTPRIDLVPRRTLRQIRRALGDEGHFAVLGEAARDAELLHAVQQALAQGRVGNDAVYPIAPAASPADAEPQGQYETGRDDLLLMMSHDVRTTISVISGYATALLDIGAPVRRDGVEPLKRIQDSCRRLIGFVDDVSRLTLIGMRQAALHGEPVRPAELIRGAVEDLAGYAEARGHSISEAVEGAGDARTVERNLVLMVLRNLLDNAIKYTDPGGRIAVNGRSDPDGLTFEVRDNGRGISPEHLDSIFIRLKRFPASTLEKGSGLGLWAAKKVVELHGGRIWAESTPWQGSVFRFTVKSCPSAEPASDAVEPHSF